MKKITALLLCIVMLISLTGCGENDIPKEITILTLSNYLPTDTIKDFTADTGIAVKQVTASSYEEIQQMVEQDSSAYDVVIACDYVMDALVKGKLLQEIDYKKFPNDKYVTPGYKGKYFDPQSKFTVPYAAIGVLIGYDPAKAGIIINSYADLLAPSLKDSVIFIDDYEVVVGIANLLAGKSVDYSENLNDTVKICKALSKSRYPISGDVEYPEDLLVEGQASVGLLYTTQLGYAISANPNLEIVYPKEGFLASIDSLAISSGSDAKASAMKFINFIHDPVTNGKAVQEIGYSSANISGKQFMDEEYRNDGYNIKNSNADQCILVPKISNDARIQMQWCYNNRFLNYEESTDVPQQQAPSEQATSEQAVTQ